MCLLWSIIWLQISCLCFNNWIVFQCVDAYSFFSIEWHQGCFQFLAIVNKAAMNIVEYMSLCYTGTSSGHMSESSNRTTSNFQRKHQLDLQVVVQVYTPPSMEECSPCSSSPPEWVVTSVFYLSYFDMYKIESQCHFGLYFSDDLRMLNVSSAFQSFKFPLSIILFSSASIF